jgi:hypothetical protein
MPAPRPPLPSVDPPGWPDWVERWILPYLREHVLLPVLLALLGHVVIVLAPLMLWAWRTGSGLAAVLLVALAAATTGLCAFEAVRFRRPGVVTLTLSGLWVVSAAVAWFAGRAGLL